MKKLSEKMVSKILLVLVLVLLAVLGWALKTRENFHRELAQKNVDVWEEMLHDVEMILDVCKTPADVRNVVSIAGYMHGSFSSHQDDSMPCIGSGYYDLAGGYQSLEMKILDYVPSEDSLSPEEKEEAFELFLVMNEDIRDFCQSVVDRCYIERYGIRTEPDWKFRKGLIDYESDIFQGVLAEIQELGRKHRDLVNDFCYGDTLGVFTP